MLSEMGEVWKKFRERASQKDERQHFGLAWSVFAGYWLAGAVLLRSLHETGWLVSLADVGVLLFFVFGAFGVYLAFAVPMRWWPHQPQKRDVAKCNEIEKTYFGGLTLFQDWGKLTILSNLRIDPTSVSDQKTQHQYDQQANAIAEALCAWVENSEKQIGILISEDMAARYRLAPEPTRQPPAWTEDSIWGGIWSGVEGRLVWIRAWLREQVDL